MRFRNNNKKLLVIILVVTSLINCVYPSQIHNVYAEENVTVNNCSAWHNDPMSYTYLNQDLEKVCTDEALEKICGKNTNWENCANEGKGEEIVDKIDKKVTDNVITTPTTKDQCHEGSGIVGWIICPIINGISGIGEWLWGQIESNFLKLPAGALFRDNNGVEAAWRSFRDIANLLFIVLFMIVIFSQLTGIGIDNFGIKKILSKLIVVAILINLSYLICILAVDLSNVLGTGLNDSI